MIERKLLIITNILFFIKFSFCLFRAALYKLIFVLHKDVQFHWKTHCYDIQNNETQHNDTLHMGQKCDSERILINSYKF